MAGDHKCPVCQATFTRPQHVARHMRSHTGDRPYKCQHCGDQFARSDLLSRHVNKCHPNEKPLVSSAPSRRKGTSSASRATTSKQACDQCVQSTLPCDGANPCSKCVHRKTRCTYVKFHRQTAPLGPGHPARPPNDPSNPALPSLGVLPSGPNPYRLSDSFFLSNNGTTLNPSGVSQSPASALYANHQFTFPPPLQVSAPASYDNSLDYTARYRAQADFLSRAGVIPQDRAPPLPAIYQDSQAPQDPSAAARYVSSYHMRDQDYPLPPSPNGVDYGYNIDNKSEYPSDVPGYSANGYNPHPLPFNLDTQSHQRCESSASDTGSTTSRSQPSSATSSSVHLPLVAEFPQQSYSRPATADGVVQQDREGFSSAFGLMSLDDSDVLGGFGEGAPFFDDAINHGSGSSPNPSWGDGPTPRANPHEALPANGKKGAQQQQQQPDQSQGQGNGSAATPASLKELKEIWKQYMRTPLSGQPLAPEHPAGSPKRERGLSRVASLPSVKTPSATTAGWGDPMRGVNGSQQPQQQQPQQHMVNGTNNAQYGGHATYSRMHGTHTDDLRSYEQAVLARRTPLTLHLAPRRRGNTTSTGPAAPQAPPPPPPAGAIPGRGNRASPAGSGSGSGSDRSMSSFTDDRRASSTSASPAPHLGGGGALGVDDASRPAFKRLPSQTLGPEYTKRPATVSMLSGAREGFPGLASEHEMQQRGLGMAERARRMSFPSGRAGVVGLQD